MRSITFTYNRRISFSRDPLYFILPDSFHNNSYQTNYILSFISYIWLKPSQCACIVDRHSWNKVEARSSMVGKLVETEFTSNSGLGTKIQPLERRKIIKWCHILHLLGLSNSIRCIPSLFFCLTFQQSDCFAKPVIYSM